MVSVLYIDDEAETEKLQSRKELLENRGMKITLVASAKEALDYLDRLGEFDVVVLDVIIPPEGVLGIRETAGGTETGLRILTLIRAKSRRLPVLIFSVRRIEELKKSEDNDPYTSYLWKTSTSTDEVAAAIMSLIGGRS